MASSPSVPLADLQSATLCDTVPRPGQLSTFSPSHLLTTQPLASLLVRGTSGVPEDSRC